MNAAARHDRRRVRLAARGDDSDSVDQYLHDVGTYALLTCDEEVALGRRARDGDGNAAAELVNRNLRFVISVAKKYQHRGLPLTDLIGEGNVGLLTAARRLNPDQGVRFISYAVWWIRQAILTALTRQVRIVRMPANRAAAQARAIRTADLLRQKLTREPTTQEVADSSGVALDLIQSVDGLGFRDISLDSPLRNNGEQSLLERFIIDEDSDAESEVASSLLTGRIEKALNSLPPRNARILRLHFGLEGGREHTLEEIGSLLGVTRERIRQLRDRALRRLREGDLGRALGASAPSPDRRTSGTQPLVIHARVHARRRCLAASTSSR